MSDAFTPDEEQVREQYTQEQPPQIGSVAEKRAEFDRFIARVRSEAWEEGNRWGFEQHCNDQENCWDETEVAGDNPYREGESNE